MPLLIDGHNLIAKLPSISLDDPHDETQLVELLRRYRARTGKRIQVIFVLSDCSQEITVSILHCN